MVLGTEPRSSKRATSALTTEPSVWLLKLAYNNNKSQILNASTFGMFQNNLPLTWGRG